MNSADAEIPEPTAVAFAGSSMAARMRRLWFATRPAFMPASLAPVIVGSVWGYHVARQFDWLVFALALAATLSVHLAANVLNDVGDDRSGSDRRNEQRIFPYTGGSRFIQNGIMTAREMLRWGVMLLVIALLLGVALVYLRGTTVLLFGAAGVAIGVFYSLPPIQLAARGVGEVCLALAFGVLPVMGAAWLQSGQADAASVLIAVPVSLWVTAILLINEVPDRLADASAGKRTLVVRLGLTATRRLYLVIHVFACLGVCLTGLLNLLPWWASVMAVPLLFVAHSAAKSIDASTPRERLRQGIQTTLKLHSIGCGWLVIAMLASLSGKGG